MIKRLVTLGLAILLTAIVAAAQSTTLTLRNGQQYQGTYLGGTRNRVQFLVNGQVKVFRTSEIVSIIFESTQAIGDAAPAQPADMGTSAPTLAPEPGNSAASTADNGLTQTVTVPQGTAIMVRMIDSVDSSVNKPGDIFHASLENDLMIGDVLVAKKGADVYGKLTQVKSAGKLTGKSELALELTGIRTVSGQVQPVVSATYEQAGKSRTKQTAERGIGGAVAGAVLGGIFGGGSGAAKGAAAGAAVGTGVQLITHGQQIKIPSETLLEFKLDQPFMITLPKAGQ